MKKHLLIGNGFDIQFGGRAFTSQLIIQRIKYRAQMGIYASLFEKTISGQEIVAIVEGFVTVANSLMSGKYDQYIQDAGHANIKTIRIRNNIDKNSSPRAKNGV